MSQPKPNPHEIEDTDCYMRLTLPDGSEAFIRRDRYKTFYRAIHQIFAKAEFARHLPPNSKVLPHLPNRLTCEEIVLRAAVKRKTSTNGKSNF